MTLLSYSGRGGRGGRGAGAGRERGGGRGFVTSARLVQRSKQWLRPHDTWPHGTASTAETNDKQESLAASSLTTTTAVTIKEHSFHRDGAGGNTTRSQRTQNVRSAEPGERKESAKLLPQQTRFGSHAWKRADSEHHRLADASEEVATPRGPQTENSSRETARKPSPPFRTNTDQAHATRKVVIEEQGVEEPSSHDGKNRTKTNDPSLYVSSGKGTSLRRPTTNVLDLRSKDYPSRNMKSAKPRHKPVDNNLHPKAEVGAPKNNKWLRSKVVATGTVTAAAAALTLSGQAKATRLKYSKTVAATSTSEYRHGGPRRRHDRPTIPAPAPKRIKVSHAVSRSGVLLSSDNEKDNNEELEGTPERNDNKLNRDTDTLDEQQQKGKKNDVASAVEKLTDFAYRETNHHCRGKKSRGLVRVQPQSAPICPTFLRGVACKNESCMKRHDVPQEYAMPICSFFQRQGMCLKENCRFRHVKVNPRAAPCPSFDLLGFCEDPNCTMMHNGRPRKI